MRGLCESPIGLDESALAEARYLYELMESLNMKLVWGTDCLYGVLRPSGLFDLKVIDVAISLVWSSVGLFLR